MSIITFTYQIIDGKTPPQKSEITLYCIDTGLLTTAELTETANDSIGVIADLITGGILGCRIGFEPILANLVANPAWKIPDPDSDVEEGAKLVFRPLDGDIRPTTIRIPTFNEDFIVSGTRIVDTDEPEVQLFVDMVTDGAFPYSFDFDYSDSRGADLATYLSGEESFKRRKYKKGKR